MKMYQCEDYFADGGAFVKIIHEVCRCLYHLPPGAKPTSVTTYVRTPQGLTRSSIQSSNQGVNLFHCSNNLIRGFFGAGIELFNAVLTLLIGGLTAENEQFPKRINPRDAYLMILQ